MISCDIYKSHNFQTLFAFFKIFKSFAHTIMGVFPGQYVQIFFFIYGKGLKLR
jgi:hypothetical protein